MFRFREEATAKKIIEAHSGTIEVKSKPGRGATFRFSLRLVEPGSD